MVFKYSLLALTAASLITASQANSCPPLGPTLPSTKTPSNSTIVQETILKIQEGLANFTSVLNYTAISIGVKSIHEDGPLFDWHYTPPIADNRSVAKVDIDTVYRGGSITKVFTTLTALKNSHIKGSDPVTKYLPQLKTDALKNEGQLSFIPWDNITIEDLASHVSGLGGDSRFTPRTSFSTLLTRPKSLPISLSSPVPGHQWVSPQFPTTLDQLAPVSSAPSPAQEKASHLPLLYSSTADL